MCRVRARCSSRVSREPSVQLQEFSSANVNQFSVIQPYRDRVWHVIITYHAPLRGCAPVCRRRVIHIAFGACEGGRMAGNDGLFVVARSLARCRLVLVERVRQGAVGGKARSEWLEDGGGPRLVEDFIRRQPERLLQPA